MDPTATLRAPAYMWHPYTHMQMYINKNNKSWTNKKSKVAKTRVCLVRPWASCQAMTFLSCSPVRTGLRLRSAVVTSLPVPYAMDTLAGSRWQKLAEGEGTRWEASKPVKTEDDTVLPCNDLLGCDVCGSCTTLLLASREQPGHGLSCTQLGPPSIALVLGLTLEEFPFSLLLSSFMLDVGSFLRHGLHLLQQVWSITDENTDTNTSTHLQLLGKWLSTQSPPTRNVFLW